MNDGAQPRSASPRGPLVVAVLLGLVAVAVSALHPKLGDRNWCDDAFITFRHVRHLFEGHGLVFNVGERVEGYTNFLWGMVAYVGMFLGAEPIATSAVVGWIAQFLTVLLVYDTGRRLGASAWGALVAPALLCVNVGFLAYPTSGMETTFHVFLTAAAVRLMVGEHERTTRWSVTLGLVWLLLALNRFDGFVLVGMLGAWQVLWRREIKATLPAAVVLLVGLGAYNAWRISYYGLLLPNTAYAKGSVGAARYLAGALYLEEWASGVCGALALAAVPFTLRRGAAGHGLLAWLVVCQAAYVLQVGGDWMEYHRFMLPVVPCLFLLAQRGCTLVARGVSAGAGGRATGLSVPGLVLGGALLLATNALGLAEGLRTGFRGPSRHFDEHDAKLIGEHLASVVPEDELVAIEWAGIVPYYAPHPFLDTFGLTDRAFVQDESLRRTVWGVWVTPTEIARRRPEAILFCARVFPSEMHARAAIEPGGPCHYGRYMNMDQPPFPYEFTFPEIAPGKWYPMLRRVERPRRSGGR